MNMSERESIPEDQAATLLALYDSALPQVYGYLLPRCSSEAVAEDLTAEYVACSPRLLEVDCRTVEHLKLANVLCRFVELAEENA